jgi:hypothetical protein
MIESLEDKRYSLKVAGETLSFITGDIIAIPCEHVNDYRLETDNEVYQSKEYYFQAIEEDITLYAISSNSTFTYIVGSKVFHFKIVKISSDINGWKKLTCNLEDIV